MPVPYLRNVAKHGAKYRTAVPNPQGVQLQHTKSYSLVNPESRSAFFRLIARLIWYLSSGTSHVPYLWNREDNPINSVPSCIIYLMHTRAGGKFFPKLLMRTIVLKNLWRGCSLHTPTRMMTRERAMRRKVLTRREVI